MSKFSSKDLELLKRGGLAIDDHRGNGKPIPTRVISNPEKIPTIRMNMDGYEVMLAGLMKRFASKRTGYPSEKEEKLSKEQELGKGRGSKKQVGKEADRPAREKSIDKNEDFGKEQQVDAR